MLLFCSRVLSISPVSQLIRRTRLVNHLLIFFFSVNPPTSRFTASDKMSGGLTICKIPDELKETLKKFRFAKSTTMNALIIKIDRDAQEMRIDEEMEDVTMEEIRDELPHMQPRFLLLSYAYKHADGRTAYPMCMIFYSPPGCSPEQQMLYAGSRNNLVNECELTKNFEVRDQEELTQEYIDSKAV